MVNRGDPSMKSVAYRTPCSSNMIPIISAAGSLVAVSTPVMLTTCWEVPVLGSIVYNSLAVVEAWAH